MIVETFCARETWELGKESGRTGKTGDGDCPGRRPWSGKDCIYPGICRRTGDWKSRSTVPTFTIVQVYEGGRLPFYHFDVYRIGDVEEMEEIGYEDCFYGEGVCLIEWADLIREILPEKICRVTIEKDLEKGFDYRKITLGRIRGMGGIR